MVPSQQRHPLIGYSLSGKGSFQQPSPYAEHSPQEARKPEYVCRLTVKAGYNQAEMQLLLHRCPLIIKVTKHEWR